MEKEMCKSQVNYEMCGDKVFFIIPQGNYNEHRLAMTKDLFIACYEHWIKKVEHDKVLTEEKTGKWIPNDNGTFSCSLCHSWIPNEQHHYARYCLYCGARMED